MKKHARDLIVQQFPTVAQSHQLRQLSKELLLEIIDALAQLNIDSQGGHYQDMVNDIDYGS